LGVGAFAARERILEEKMQEPFIASFAFSFSFLVLALPPVFAEGSTRPAAGNLKGAALGPAVERLVKQHGAEGWQVGVVILDDQGKQRVSLSGERPLSPASNQKILVVGVALGLLGPDFRYQTVLAARSAPAGGTVPGLVVQGDGDPNISARFHSGDPIAVFRSWAAELKKAGLQRVAGDLVVDDSRFDAVRFAPGWKENQAGSSYSAEVGALNLNDNCVEVSVKPTRPGQPAKVELIPPTSYISIDNQCQTVAEAKARPILHRKPGTNTIIVRDGISQKAKDFTSSVTVQDPGLYFGTVLAEVLKAEGIAIDGKVARSTLARSAGDSPVVLLRHSSPLADDLTVINKKSQNLHAEVLLKALGAKAEGEGSAAAGGRAIAAFLKQKGLPAEGLQVEDGSGLSSGNRVSPATLAAVLSWIRKQPFWNRYLESLPVAGKDGTLKKRFKGRNSASHIFAKTGYIGGVSALSGYVERGGRHWVFSVVVNGLRTGGNRSRDILSARALQEEIGEEVYQAMAE
jgi:D-alanyl-D-alanine carboxypeptidase/D-alanyl-D-alanine-endopeptidase (penicillin-binding protein 4)